jgi:hypothetical protein
MGSLFLDILMLFTAQNTDRLFTRSLVNGLNDFLTRPWAEQRNGKPISDLWLAQQLRPYGIRPRSLRISDVVARGYLKDDFMDSFRRYISRSELDALTTEIDKSDPPEANLH